MISSNPILKSNTVYPLIMVKKIILQGLLHGILALPLMAQVTVSGKVTDIHDKPIAYANIGIVNSTAGTLSNIDGSFRLNVPRSLYNESIVFSAIGYERTQLPVPSHTGKILQVRLKESVTTLKNVTVLAKEKQNKKWLGNKKKHLLGLGSMHYDSSAAGGAYALLIQNDDPGLRYLEEARLFIMRNTMKEFKIRVRIMEADTTNHGLPGKDLIHESIVVASSMKKGWLTFDLSPHHLTVDREEFFLVFEWIYEDVDRKNIARQYKDFMAMHPDRVTRDTVTIDGKKIPQVQVSNFVVGTFFRITKSKRDLRSKKCYSRESSFGSWERSSSIISAKVLLSD